MNTHVMDWVTALRSGDHTQGRGALRDRSKSGRDYCCLGVAVEITDPSLFVTLSDEDASDIDYVMVSGHHCGNALPEWLAEMLELSSVDQGCLTVLNDRDRLSFNKIADLLEAWQRAGGASRQSFRDWHETFGADVLRSEPEGWAV